MNRLLISGLLALLLAPLPALAADAAPPAAKGGQAPATLSDEEYNKQMAQFEENLKKMQAQVEQMRKATDPAARQRLMQEHMASMQSNMALMNQMMGCCAQGPGGQMMGAPMMGRGMTGGPRMGQMMGMQQVMMQHMMLHMQQHQQMMQPK